MKNSTSRFGDFIIARTLESYELNSTFLKPKTKLEINKALYDKVCTDTSKMKLVKASQAVYLCDV